MPNPLDGQRILIVEDEAIIAMMIEDTLADAGATVIGVEGTLAGALRKVRSSPELTMVMMDINLHGQRSDALADLLALRSLPFVIITGYGADGISDKYREQPVVAKPFYPQHLIDVISDLTKFHIVRNDLRDMRLAKKAQVVKAGLNDNADSV
jgi:CheY-like chemotaxis protein